MATFRRVITSFPSSSSSYPYSNTAAQPAPSLSGTDYPHDHQSSPTSPTMRKRQRTLDQPNPADPAQAHQQQPQPVTDDAFIADNDAVDSNAEDDDDDGEKPKSDKKAGRRKIKIEFIQDKSRRHITFSKRKAGIMKKAYELSTLTGTQVLLLVVSETGLVYTFTTAKLQPLVTQPEGKNLIQACLNAPQGSLPSSMPIGPPLSRSQPMNIPSGPPQPTTNNLPGGLSISPSQGGTTIKEDDSQHDEDEEHRAGPKRRRRASTAASGGANVSPRPGQTSPHSPNASIPPPLNIPGQQQGQSQSVQQGNAAQINIGSPTSPQQGHSQVPGAASPSNYNSAGQYAQPTAAHHPGDPGSGMYSPHMMQAPAAHSYYTGGPGQPGAAQQMSNMSQQQAHGHWAQPTPPQQVQGHYGGRR